MESRSTPRVVSTHEEWVIIVDDDVPMQELACATLAAGGLAATGVCSVFGLRQLVATHEPRVVVLGVSPVKAAHEIVGDVESIRSVLDASVPLVVFGVAAQDRELAKLVQQRKVRAFVRRAEDPFQLLRAIADLLPSRRPSPASGSKSGPQPAIDVSGRNLRLLLIDDSELTLGLMQERLSQIGFDVRIAVALGEAQSILRGWCPNVVVADVNMPEMRGDDLCARIKSKTSRDVLIFLCSSMPEAELRMLASAAGADGYVSKTSGHDAVANRIALLCKRLPTSLSA